MSIVLKVKNLGIKFPETSLTAVKDSNFSLEQGEILALVGESGSGKSLTALSILGLEPSNAEIRGQIYFKDQELLNYAKFSPASKRKYPSKIRGNAVAYIPQDPLSALNPMYTILNQLAEAVTVYHSNYKSDYVYDLCFKQLEQVGIADPERCLKAYPHEISGGMRQRVMIAMALINDPELLIADEPTTALDVTIQATIIQLLRKLKKTILFITHDLAVVAEIADRVIVMKQGEIIEESDVFKIFVEPKKDYTKKLLTAIPKV